MYLYFEAYLDPVDAFSIRFRLIAALCDDFEAFDTSFHIVEIHGIA
jgi:hypothetical protein